MALRCPGESLPFVLLVSAAVVSGFAARGQVPEPRGQGAPIKSEVRLVLVDVVVTSSNRRPVPGLRKEDFQIAEDGRPQTISFFEEHKDSPAATISLPAMPPDVFTNYPTVKSTDSVNVLLLDSLNTEVPDQAFVRAQMTNYLRAAATVPTGARLSIFTLGSRLRMVRGFTADTSGLLAALSDSKSGTDPKIMRELPTPSQNTSEIIMLDSQRSPEGRAEIKQFLDEEAAARTADRAGMTLQAFQQLARYLSSIPGRKNVMWVSGSFPVNFFPTADARSAKPGRHERDIQQTADLLTADQVAVYPILATGLAVNTVYDTDNYGRLIHDDDAGRAFNQIAMETLARDTGGKAFYNSNALTESLAEAVDEGSHFYTLAYAPDNSNMDGKYRHIELKTTGGPYQLSYRRGYYADNVKYAEAGNDKKKSDSLTPLMAFGMPAFEQIVYKVRLAQANPEHGASPAGDNAKLKAPLVRCSLDFAISVQDLQLEKSADGMRRGNIEVMLVAYDRNGMPVNSFRKKSEIVLPPEAYKEVMQIGLQMHREIDVPKEEIFLRTGIYDLNSGNAGTLEISIPAEDKSAASKNAQKTR